MEFYSWYINKTSDFKKIECIQVHQEKDSFIFENSYQKFSAKKISTGFFLLKRYPLTILSSTILSLWFFVLYPMMATVYLLGMLGMFHFLVRTCKIVSLSKYLILLWGIHLSIDLLYLMQINRVNSIFETFSLELLQGIFMGMICFHLWIYLLLVFYQYKKVYQLRDKINTKWYLWKQCPLCDKNFSMFRTLKCKENI